MSDKERLLQLHGPTEEQLTASTCEQLTASRWRRAALSKDPGYSLFTHQRWRSGKEEREKGWVKRGSGWRLIPCDTWHGVRAGRAGIRGASRRHQNGTDTTPAPDLRYYQPPPASSPHPELALSSRPPAPNPRLKTQATQRRTPAKNSPPNQPRTACCGCRGIRLAAGVKC